MELVAKYCRSFFWPTIFSLAVKTLQALLKRNSTVSSKGYYSSELLFCESDLDSNISV